MSYVGATKDSKQVTVKNTFLTVKLASDTEIHRCLRRCQTWEGILTQKPQKEPRVSRPSKHTRLKYKQFFDSVVMKYADDKDIMEQMARQLSFESPYMKGLFLQHKIFFGQEDQKNTERIPKEVLDQWRIVHPSQSSSFSGNAILA